MSQVAITNQLRLSGGLVDLARCQVHREDAVLALTQREVALLRYFAANPGRAITRKELLCEVWGYVEGIRTRATDNAIVRLRNKVEAVPDEPLNVLSVRGVGYRFELPGSNGSEAGVAPLAEPTPFFGREDLLCQLGDLLGAAHLVTLVGAPGMGKTRLASQFAVGWSGPTWFADLSATETLSGIAHAVANSLSLNLDPGHDAVDQIGRSLGGQTGALLVLDNFEQVAALAPETLGAWVRAAPDCRFLATSRERLLLTGEHCLELGPLSLPAARELFVDRARAVLPSFDPEGSDDLAELVDRLDGVPLALELAACRVHMLTLQSLASRLRDLGGGRRDASPRHRTLLAAFQWSWDLLGEEEQEAMRQCALFEAPFTLEAAEQVLSLRAPVFEIIEGLRNKSMLERVEDLVSPRFRLLSTVREFVQVEGVQALDDARDRHLDWCLSRARALVSALKGRHAIVSARALAAELGDQLTALQRTRDPGKAARLLIAMDGSPALKGLPDLHLERLDAVLNGSLQAPVRCRLLLMRAGLLTVRRRFDEARSVLDEATGLAADRHLEALVALRRGYLREGEGDRDEAVRSYTSAAEAFRELGTDADLALALCELARVRFNPGDVGATEPLCIEALDVIRRVRDGGLEGRILGYLGVIAQGRRHFTEAEGYFRQSLARARSLGDPVATVVQTINAAGLLAYLEPSIETLENLEGDLRDSLDIASHLGQLHLQGAATGVLLQLLIEADRAHEGGEIIDRLPPDWTQIPPMLRAMCWSNIAAVRQLRSEAALADRAFEQATASFAETGLPRYVWRTQTFHALFLAEQDRWSEAVALFDAAESGASPPTIAPWIRDVRGAADLLLQARKADDPAPIYNRALAFIERVVEARALRDLDSPIRSSHQWIVKSLRRSVPTRYQGGSAS